MLQVNAEGNKRLAQVSILIEILIYSEGLRFLFISHVPRTLYSLYSESSEIKLTFHYLGKSIIVVDQKKRLYNK